MAYYSDELVEEVRSRNDIVDVISGYVRLQKKGSTYFGLCPFHNEKTGSFSVSPNKQMYYCFGCGAGGNVFTFLMQYENFTFPEALGVLAERVGIELPKEEATPQAKREADKRQRLLEINKTAAKYYYIMLRSDRGKRAYEYFRERGLSDVTMQKFGLGATDQYSNGLYQYLRQQGYEDSILKETGLVTIDERGGRDKFWNRAMFPIMDVRGKVIGFGGRVMGDGEPKYLNSPETKIFDKSRNLYGLNLARASRRQQILLCEGYMDVIALHQAGFDNAVASLGTAFTIGHANLLKRYTREVYLTFDSDGAGIKAALRAIPILKEVGLTARVINMKPHKDPDEFIKALGAEAYQKRIDEAENSFLFEIRILEQNYDMKDPEGKTAFYNETAKKLLGFTEEVERNNYIEAVAEKYQMGYENLRKLVNHFGAMGGIAKEREPLKGGFKEKKKKEDGMRQSQKLLLTWMIESEKAFEIIRQYTSPEDYTEELFKRTARILYQQKKHGEIKAADIVSASCDEEEAGEIAEMFHTKLDEIGTNAEKEKALKETIMRVKKNSIDYRFKHLESGDTEGFNRLVAERRENEMLNNLHISID